MTTKSSKSSTNNDKTIDSAVARVHGAVRVADASVAKAMMIKDEAIDEVEALKSEANSKAEDTAVKKIKTDTKKVMGN